MVLCRKAYHLAQPCCERVVELRTLGLGGKIGKLALFLGWSPSIGGFDVVNLAEF